MLRPIADATPVHGLHSTTFRSLANALGEAWDPRSRREPRWAPTPIGNPALYFYALQVLWATHDSEGGGPE